LGQHYQSQRLKETNKLIKNAGSVLGIALEPLGLIVKRRMLYKLMNIKRKTLPTLCIT